MTQPVQRIDRDKNPFEKGVWILYTLGGCDMIALVEEDQSKDDLIKELMNSKCICVTLKRRYILKQVQFPMPEMDNKGKPTGNWQTGAIPTIGKHEINLELMNEFPLYACLNNIAFLSDFAEEDLARLRQNVINADIGAEMMIRATKANILIPKGPSL